MIASTFSPLPETEKHLTLAEMKPLDVAVILQGKHAGTIIMRTADADRFEAIDLSDPGADKCWMLDIAANMAERAIRETSPPAIVAGIVRAQAKESDERRGRIPVRLLPSGTQITLTVQ